MKRQASKRKKIYVAMSGGVDSSVAAALFKKRGFNVTGIFMRPWQPEGIKCFWQKDREDAMRVATKINIPLLTWDFSKEYKEEVADYMIREYKAGRTPNPDIMCNKHIKFGLFLEKALKDGADYIATGHYVRLERIRDADVGMVNSQHSHRLFKAKDKNKDQSYFLWTLTQDQLKCCLFPIGDYTKPEIRRMAKKFGLPTADKKDSQGVCFIGSLNMKEFLKNYIRPKRGNIVLLNTTCSANSGQARLTRSAHLGRVVGQHDGVFYYTIGQRHGLDIKSGKGPYFVVKKDLKRNIVYVGSKKDLLVSKMQLTDINWINNVNQPVDKRLAKSFIHRGWDLDVRIRYGAQLSKAVVKSTGKVIFQKPETAITPGQSAVFYKGEEMLGGGIIMSE